MVHVIDLHLIHRNWKPQHLENTPIIGPSILSVPHAYNSITDRVVKGDASKQRLGPVTKDKATSAVTQKGRETCTKLK